MWGVDRKAEVRWKVLRRVRRGRMPSLGLISDIILICGFIYCI
jgi:hypothetical protein